MSFGGFGIREDHGRLECEAIRDIEESLALAHWAETDIGDVDASRPNPDIFEGHQVFQFEWYASRTLLETLEASEIEGTMLDDVPSEVILLLLGADMRLAEIAIADSAADPDSDPDLLLAAEDALTSANALADGVLLVKDVHERYFQLRDAFDSYMAAWMLALEAAPGPLLVHVVDTTAKDLVKCDEVKEH